MATKVASLFGELKLKDDNFNRGLERASGNLDTLSGKVQRVGGQLTKFGGALTVGVTTPIIGMGAAAVRTGVQMESAFTGVIKTVDATDAQIASLRGELEDMATAADSPVAALENAHVELFQIAEAAGQLGVAVDDIDEFTETVAMLAMTTDIAGEEGARSLAQFTNITGFNNADIMRLGDVIADLGNNSATTESQILELGKRIATLSSIGLDESELLGYAAAISSAGISAELGGTNFIKGVNEMVLAASAGGPALDQMADIAGMTSDSFQDLVKNDPSSAIQAFLVGLGEMDRAAQVTALDELNIKGQEAQRVFTTLAGNTDLVSSSLNIANDAFVGNGALMTEAATRADTTAGQFNVLKNNVNQLGGVIAEVLLPPINRFLPLATQTIQKLSEANPQFIQGAVVVAGMAAAAGPLITAVGALTTGIGLLLSPVGLLIVAIGGILAVANSNYPGGIVGLFTDANTTAKMLADIGMASLRKAVDWTGNQIDIFRNKVREAKQELEALQNRISAGTGGIGGIIQASGQQGFGGTFRNALGFADGGNPPIGRPSIVGEKGPEIIVPRRATTVIPNEMAFGGGGQNVTLNVNIQNMRANDESEVMKTVRAIQSGLDNIGVKL